MAPGLGADQLVGRPGVDGLREVKSLRVLAAERPEMDELFLALHSFGDDIHAEVVRQGDNRTHHLRSAFVHANPAQRH